MISGIVWGVAVVLVRIAELVFTNTPDRPDALLRELGTIFLTWGGVGFVSGVLFAGALALTSRIVAVRRLSYLHAVLTGLVGGAVGFLTIVTLLGGGLQYGVSTFLLMQVAAFGGIGAVVGALVAGVANRGRLPAGSPPAQRLHP
jgi:hypothetical protein